MSLPHDRTTNPIPDRRSDGISKPVAETWLWLGLIALLLLSFGDAHLHPNEPVYLIGPLRLLDPAVLQIDWSVGGDPFATMALPFRLLCAPLWLLSDDPLIVALMGRVLLWLWVIAGFRSLAAAFHLPAWAWSLGLALYISTSRGLSAGEWIFGGAEQKVACYGAVLFALSALARGRPVAAGAWVGLATAFHIVVGGWSAIALGVASLADLRRLRFQRLVVACLASLAIASPAILLGVRYLASSVAPEAAPQVPPDASHAEILTLLALPHHADPVRFLNLRTVIEIPLIFGAVMWLVSRTAPRTNRRVLTFFVGTICAVFLAGLFARPFEIYEFLVFYPFRVADSLVPMIFWLCVPTTAYGAFQVWRKGDARLDRITMAVLVIAALFFVVEVRHLVRNSYRTVVSWSPAARATRASELAIYHEIRALLPADAIIAAGPCESREWLYGRRALVASRKSVPANARVHAWSERIVALQGGEALEPFRGQRCEEVRRGFSSLPLSRYAFLRDRFGATHALLDFAREDLAKFEVARRSGRSIVSLESIDARAEVRASTQATRPSSREGPAVGETHTPPDHPRADR